MLRWQCGGGGSAVTPKLHPPCRYTVGPSEGFAAAGAFAGFQVLVLIVMRVWCRPTKLVRAPLTPRRHKEAKHSRDEWLDKLRDKIKVMLEVRPGWHLVPVPRVWPSRFAVVLCAWRSLATMS